MAMTFRRPFRRLPGRPDVVAVWGYSGSGKDTMVAELLRQGFLVFGLSAGHHNKLRLLEMGVKWDVMVKNLPERYMPHPCLPMKPGTEEHYRPHEYETQVVNNRTPFTRHAVMNERAVLRALRSFPQKGTLFLLGYRGPAQHALLCRLQRRLGAGSMVMVRLRCRQITETRFKEPGWNDDLCRGQAFDLRVVNDKTVPPRAMVRQLLTGLRRRKVKRAL